MQKRIQEEHEEREKNEKMVSDLEKMEMELIAKLQATRAQQDAAHNQLEATIDQGYQTTKQNTSMRSASPMNTRPQSNISNAKVR